MANQLEMASVPAPATTDSPDTTPASLVVHEQRYPRECAKHHGDLISELYQLETLLDNWTLSFDLFIFEIVT